ncbi:MAG TPA: ABC transporter permease subunit [Candidatus Lustribacter sp.]|jgi:NitT/TauT family transport system permease protein|nr:ABC transporter permease subunit [Candidatus Lustribacter sp.]
MRGNAGAVRIGVIVLLVLLWELLARRFGNPLLVAPPSTTLVTTIALLGDPQVTQALLAALRELAIAFVIAVVAGLVIALPLGLSTFWRGALLPLVLGLYAVPQVTVLPLFVRIFGLGPPTKIAFGVTHGIFAVILTVIAAARAVDPHLLRAATSLGATRRQMIVAVVLPSLVPSLFTGMRLAMSGVLLGVLLAELYVSTTGIGFFTQAFTNAFAPAKLFGLILLLAAIAIALNELTRMAERRFSRWRENPAS